MALERSVFQGEELISFVRIHYGLHMTSAQKLPLGSANCFHLSDGNTSYFLKEFQSGVGEEDVIAEADLLARLRERGIPVAPFIPTKEGAWVVSHRSHAVCLQEYIEGTTYGYDDFPPHLMLTLARTLGRLHTAMRDMALPAHRDANWAASYRGAESAAQYDALLAAAEQHREDAEYPRIISELQYKKELAYRCESYARFYEGITYCPTHGDFQGCQTIWEGESLRAIIDFSSAKRLPAVWAYQNKYCQVCQPKQVLQIILQLRSHHGCNGITGRFCRHTKQAYNSIHIISCPISQ